MSRKVHWRSFFILWVTSLLGHVALIPYVLATGMLDNVPLPVPLGVALAVIPLQGAVLYAIVIFIGLYLGRPIGFGVPYLKGGEQTGLYDLRRMLILAVGLGALCGVVLFLLDRYVFALAIPSVTSAQAQGPLWTRLLLSYYAGVNEELLFRFGLMTLMVWIPWRVRANRDEPPGAVGIWIAIVIAGIVFGLGHLPMTARFMEITGLVVIRALVLNGIASVLFGWLYWRRGLEAAIVSHFSADVLLHGLLPLVI